MTASGVWVTEWGHKTAGWFNHGSNDAKVLVRQLAWSGFSGMGKEADPANRKSMLTTLLKRPPPARKNGTAKASIQA